MNQTNYGRFASGAPLQPGARILFASLAADGHFNPLTGLALHLQQLGYDVRWYVGSAYAGKLQQMGIPHFPQQKALDVTADNLDEYFPERAGIKSGIAKLRFDLIHFFINRAPDFYADVKQIHEVFPFDLLVADICFTAIPFVKEKMNIPVLAVGIVPIAETSKDLAPVGLGMTPDTSVWGRVKQATLRYIINNILLREPLQILDRLLAEEGLQRDGSLFDTMYRKATLVLQSGTPGFEYRRSDLSRNIRFAGPLLPAASAKTKAYWNHPKLHEYKKLVLVTQGTAEPDVEKLIVPTLEAFKGSSHLVVVTTAGNSTAELRERYPQENIIIEDFIPFADIMPFADVYVSNGGYGGVMLGIQHQLPMVVAGVNEGKNEICARVGYFRLGINLKTETPAAQQVKKAVENILADEGYAENVKALAQEFARYNPQDLCAGYVAELLQKTKPKVYRKAVVVSDEIY